MEINQNFEPVIGSFDLSEVDAVTSYAIRCYTRMRRKANIIFRIFI